MRDTRLDEDAALGIVLSTFFGFGIVLLTFIAKRNDANQAGLDRYLFGQAASLREEHVVTMAVLGAIALVVVGLFYKELKLLTFDPGLAAALGFSPVAVHYALMTVMSVTTVGAFSAVGAILVVALMIVPAATAYLLTDRLPVMIGLAVAVGALSAVTGFLVASALDASVAGAMATITGVFFGLALLFSPLHGLVARGGGLRREQLRLAAESLVIHLANHEGDAAESAVGHLGDELRWRPDFAQATMRAAIRDGLVERENGHLALTDRGRAAARSLQAT